MSNLFVNMSNFFRDLPKIELHAHLNGSLSNSIILELHKQKYGRPFDENFNTDNYKIVSEKLLNLSSCFEKFKFAHDLTDSPENLALATKLVIGEFAEDNVIYLELRSTPRGNKDEYISTICNSILDCKKKHDILVKYIPSIDRSQGQEAAEDTLKAVLKAKEKYPELIVGIDLSGNPEVGEFKNFSPVLEKTKASGLKLAIHCAEIKDRKDEIMEMLKFGIDRIGHGTFLDANEETWNKFLKTQILVECCLSSNVKCGSVENFNTHHIKKLLDFNRPIAICTDDSGVFDTTLSNEFEICSESYNLQKEAILEIVKDSIKHSFANDNEKDDLLSVVQKFADKLEK